VTLDTWLQALEDDVLRRDAHDPLRRWRSMFYIPRTAAGEECVYFSGNSLGLRPRGVRAALEQELRDWEKLGVLGHFRAQTPWYSYHEQFRDSAAAIVGAKPGEVVMMNSLTTNLHLMMVSFYRPRGRRTRILIDTPVFPSDLYAVQSQAALHGCDPRDSIIAVGGADRLDEAEIERILGERGEEIALVLLAGVNYLTGQWLDMPRLTRAAHAAGCKIGFDLAHAAGNVAMRLHEWEVDFAVWCTYKYLNSGPGAVGGCFVHERYADDPSLPRLAGWWGNDPQTRFEMPPEFVPQSGAAGWQLSNAPVMNMAACRVSHDIFQQAGMDALRAKSVELTQYLWDQLQALPRPPFDIITPADSARRGCQLSLRVRPGVDAEELLERLDGEGVICDFRRPDVLRVAPVPLYNSFHDVWRFVSAVSRLEVP
jgi:kynureninase